MHCTVSVGIPLSIEARDSEAVGEEVLKTGSGSVHRKSGGEAPRIGILQLDTRFPRFVGDIGNPDTFRFETVHRTVPGASVAAAVTGEDLSVDLVAAFRSAARCLEGEGVCVIGTSCGFLAPLQDTVQQHLRVPFISSSLVLIPFLRHIYGDRSPVGILTYDGRRLGPRHLRGMSGEHLHPYGLDPGSAWFRAIAGQLEHVTREDACRDVLAVAGRCVREVPGLRFIVLECTNFSPFKESIRAETGVPVFDLVDALQWVAGASGGPHRARPARQAASADPGLNRDQGAAD